MTDSVTELIVAWSELKSLKPICFFLCRRVFCLIGGASRTIASTTADVIDRPDIAENRRTSGVEGDSGSATVDGHSILSANFSVDVRSAVSLSKRCLAILSCSGRPRTTRVAFVGETVSSSMTSSLAPSVNKCSFRAGLFRTVTFLMRLSSHSLSTSLISPPLAPHSPSKTTNSCCESPPCLGVVVPSLSDSRPRPKPTSFLFIRCVFGSCGISDSDCLADARIGRTVETSSSSEESGFSRAVLKESVRDEGYRVEGYRSLAGGRNANGGIALGGVTSGVGGLL